MHLFSACYINGTCIESGISNPENDCEVRRLFWSVLTQQGCVLDYPMNWTSISGSCDDANVCTENDTCESGVCVGTVLDGCGFSSWFTFSSDSSVTMWAWLGPVIAVATIALLAVSIALIIVFTRRKEKHGDVLLSSSEPTESALSRSALLDTEIQTEGCKQVNLKSFPLEVLVTFQ